MQVFDSWHFHHPYILLASSVPCIALSHLESWCKLRRCIQILGMICYLIRKPNYIFLKTATIPTYYGISIAIPRYIAMQHPSFITWLDAILHRHIAFCMIIQPHDSLGFALIHIFATCHASIIAIRATLAEAYRFHVSFPSILVELKVCWYHVIHRMLAPTVRKRSKRR